MKKIFFFLLYFFISNSLYSNEIQILSEIVGDGIEISNHSKVSVHYIGKLEDLSEFDNSYIRGEVFKFQVGTRQVIPGWETGLLGMKEGGKRTIFIPYKLAYGDRGIGNSIPPKSNLIFEIEVISVIPPKYKNIDSYTLKTYFDYGYVLITPGFKNSNVQRLKIVYHYHKNIDLEIISDHFRSFKNYCSNLNTNKDTLIINIQKC